MDVTNVSIALVTCLLLVGCSSASDNPVCTKPHDSSYTELLERDFRKASIQYTIRNDGFICYSADDGFEVDRIDARIAEYRYRVALLVTDSQTEGRLVSWLKREKKEYRVSAVEGGGLFYVIHSTSMEDSEYNQEAIRQIQLGAIPPGHGLQSEHPLGKN